MGLEFFFHKNGKLWKPNSSSSCLKKFQKWSLISLLFHTEELQSAELTAFQPQQDVFRAGAIILMQGYYQPVCSQLKAACRLENHHDLYMQLGQGSLVSLVRLISFLKLKIQVRVILKCHKRTGKFNSHNYKCVLQQQFFHC